MDLDVVFLGTSASAPTAGRAPTALLVRRGGDRLLFDCGEGTQRQLMRSTLGLPDLEAIYLTHYHADHTLGLPGLLKTFALRGREVPLTVFGPPGLRELFNDLRRVFGKVTYPLETIEVRPGEALERDGYRILGIPVHHGISAVGYAVVEDDKHLFPPYNISFGVRDDALKKLGPEGQKVIEDVQKPLTEKVMQELNARVDIDKQKPEQAAKSYLQQAGFIK